MPRRRGLRVFGGRLVIAFVIASLTMLAAVVTVNYVINVKLASAKRVKVHTAVATGGPLNFLVLGADTQALDNLSDTMWVVRIDPGQKHALVVSFPRDLWVNVPGQGLAKINASNNGGPQKVIDTMKADFGISINHYLQVDYKSFQGVVNAIGTVPVYLPYPARDDKSGFFSPVAGCKTFTGYDALQYVRARGLSYYSVAKREWLSADAIPDINRIARQQDFVRRLGSLAASKSLNDPLTANEIVNRVLENLTIDAGLSRHDVLTIVDTFLGIDPSDTRHVQFETVPWAEGPNQQGESVLYLRQPDVDPVMVSLGGTGIRDNPFVTGSSGTPTVPSANTGTTTTVATTPTTAPSGRPQPTIANQSALGSPAPRGPPC